MPFADMLSLFVLAASPAVGSFIGVVVDRTERREGFVSGRSRCDHCGAVLGVRDLVPLLSWLAAGGRSRCCGRPLRTFLPAVEGAAVAVALWSVLAAWGPVGALTAVLGWWLLALALIDLREYRLPDAGTLPLLAAGLAVSAAGLTGPLWAHLLGAVLGYASLAGLAYAYRRLRGIDGLGLGDAKLLAAGGAWAGAAALPSILLWAGLSGLAAAAALALAGRPMGAQTALPFGPGLALGLFLTWTLGPLVFAG